MGCNQSSTQLQDLSLESIKHIEEEILIIGGGPAGSLLAHVFATKYNYKVRIIERYPDFSSPDQRYEDRSGIMSMSYRTTNLFEKFGLYKEFLDIVVPIDSMTFVIQDMKMKMELLPGKKLYFHQVARKNLNDFLIQVNKKNPNITYEFDTKVSDVDLENKTFISENRATEQIQKRKFTFILGADGYNSQVREGIDQQLVKDRNLPKDTVLTKIEEFPLFIKNIYMDNYEQWLNTEEEIKQGKFPLYEKLDKKFKSKILCGKYIADPSTLHAYGAQNFIAFNGPSSNGKSNVVVGMYKDKESYTKHLENHPELKDSWRFNTEIQPTHDELKTDEQIHDFCAQHIPQFYGQVPDMVEQWKKSPLFKSQTVFCDNWYYSSDACLFGDACDGMPYVSANGFNITIESFGRFFEILDKQIQGDSQKFLSDPLVRKQVFHDYQQACFKDTRACQEGDIRDAMFPGLAYAQHPKSQLFSAVEQTLFKECEGIYNTKINFCFFSQDSFHSAHTKDRLFKDYICGKIENAEKIEDIDLSKCKQELTELLQKNNLTVEYKIDESCVL